MIQEERTLDLRAHTLTDIVVPYLARSACSGLCHPDRFAIVCHLRNVLDGFSPACSFWFAPWQIAQVVPAILATSECHCLAEMRPPLTSESRRSWVQFLNMEEVLPWEMCCPERCVARNVI